MDTSLESGQDGVVQTNGDPVFRWRQGIKRSALGTGGVIYHFGKIFGVREGSNGDVVLVLQEPPAASLKAF
jgi:hypothetical protein